MEPWRRYGDVFKCHLPRTGNLTVIQQYLFKMPQLLSLSDELITIIMSVINDKS